MSDNYQIQGRVVHVGETQTFGAKNFRKRLLVVKTSEKYPQEIPIEFVQDKVEDLDRVGTDSEVRVAVNIEGRHWKDDRWFVSLRGWRIDVEVHRSQSEPRTYQTEQRIPEDEKQDEIPF